MFLLINFAVLKRFIKAEMKQTSRLLFVLLTIMVLIATSCRKDDIINKDPNLKLEFSADSVIFDTVFTSIGSITKSLLVYNTHNKRVNISNISLAQGNQSMFRMNADGVASTAIYDLEIAPHDSLFIFLRVTIDPSNQNNPLVVEEDLIFETNGNEQTVKLVAWGQDAHFILADRKIGGFPKFKIVADSMETTVWTADKPYVVYGYALIDSYGTLIIEEGTKVHFHNNSGLWAFADGVLKVRGSLENPVIFQGDRLDPQYRDLPGQWDRIWLMEGRQGFNHEIDYAVIRNGFIGIQAESFLRPTSNQLNITNTVIENHTGMGLFSRLFAIDASNLVVANCGNYGIALTAGGAYRFLHTTVANFWQYSVRNAPALFYNNFFLDSLEQPISVPLSLDFGNGIIYGSNSEEIDYEIVEGADTHVLFDHCLVKTEKDLSESSRFIEPIVNENPLFRDYDAFDYRPDTLSPVIGKGKIDFSNLIPFDLHGISRHESPDLGAFQYVYIPEEEEKR